MQNNFYSIVETQELNKAFRLHGNNQYKNIQENLSSWGYGPVNVKEKNSHRDAMYIFVSIKATTIWDL